MIYFTHMEPLEYLGLNKEQIGIYKTLLEYGTLPASSIAKYAQISRVITYRVLDQLIHLGLVEKNDSGKGIARFSPNSPEQLHHLVEQKKQEIHLVERAYHDALEQLKPLHNLITHKPGIKYFEGLSGIEKVLDDTLGAEGEILTYLDLEIVYKYFKDINEAYIKRREKFSISKKVLSLDNDFSRKRFAEIKQDNPNYFTVTETRLIKTPLDNMYGALQIYDNKVGIITVSDENLIGIIIEDERISNVLRSMFLALYNNAESFN
jgi:HTH-type transcriptional regulator, sugar sensing transcriptional regulator